MACGNVGKVGTFCAFKVYTSLAGTSLSPTCTRVCVLVLHAYLAAISLTAEVPLPVVGGQVFVLVFHHYLPGSCTCKQECRGKFLLCLSQV